MKRSRNKVCTVPECGRKHYGLGFCKRHWATNSPRARMYTCWADMINRCLKKQHHRFKYHGGRGITICERWLSFENFVADMGYCPKGLTLERINNDDNYEPSNCRWATMEEQRRNTRRNKIIEFNGERLCVADWANRIGIHDQTLRNRLLKGWPLEKALTTPKSANRA